MPAQATANSVMASAKRLMELRHGCRNKRKMAEMSVPAWPIPIHHTKLTIANPHPMGMLMPHMPTPLVNNQPMAIVIKPVKPKESAKPTYQPKEVGRLRTMELILSVTEPKVWPGPSTGVNRRICGESIGGWPALMRSPVQDSDSGPRQGK